MQHLLNLEIYVIISISISRQSRKSFPGYSIKRTQGDFFFVSFLFLIVTMNVIFCTYVVGLEFKSYDILLHYIFKFSLFRG